MTPLFGRFNWNQSFSVGVHEMDDQHKHFFDIVNGLLECMEMDDLPQEEVMKRVHQLEAYAEYHLKSEEKYFTEFACANMEEHVAAHNAFRAHVAEFRGELRHPGANVREIAGKMAHFCGSWLTTHIAIEDKKYTTCFHEHGLK